MEEKYIVSWMETMIVKYPHVYFKYHYNKELYTFYVHVYPVAWTKGDSKYSIDELRFTEYFWKKFSNKHPSISPIILFCSGEELYKLPKEGYKCVGSFNETRKTREDKIIIMDSLASPTPSKWREKALWRKRNRWWLLPWKKIQLRLIILRVKLWKNT